MIPTPLFQLMWLADDVRKDDATGKVTVTGICNMIESSPATKDFVSPIYLFFALTGLHGSVSLRLCYVDVSDNRVLIERPISVSSGDPLETVDVAVRVKKMPIPKSGVYAWELYAGGDLLGVTRIRATAK